MLKVRYLAEDQRAEVSVDQPSAAFSAVRRACEDRGDDLVRNESGTCFTIPWWSFLSCREAIGLILRQHDTGVEFDLTARDLIIEARAREDNYRHALEARPADSDLIQPQLEQAGFTRQLTREQLHNVSKLIALRSGASFSVPGSGKTSEALAYFFLRADPGAQLLVVAPKNAFAAWEEQLKECLPGTDIEFTRLTGGFENILRLIIEEPKFALITYHQLPIVMDQVAGYLTRKPTFMVLDESHRMKRGVEGKHGRTLLALSHLPRNKLILSGTPMPNSLADLVPQFDFLYPEIRSAEEDVKELIQPVYVRTTKPQLGLDPVTPIKVAIPMSPAQRKLYELLKSETAREFADIRSSDRIALRRIGHSVMRLLQLVSNPALLTQSAFDKPELIQDMLSEGGSPKMEWVCNRVRTLARQGRKSVVWSGFVDNVEILAERLRDLGAVYIHGQVEAGSELEEDTREYRVRKFHEDPQTMVLVANPAACGEGISLHKVCHHAIYLDRNYNAAQFLQSQDRIHRLGLPPGTETLIEIAYCPGSIDESVERRLTDKISLMSQVLNDPSINIEPVSVDPDDSYLTDKDVDDFLRHLRE
jgi:SNF2 family DNA or RNA helicase